MSLREIIRSHAPPRAREMLHRLRHATYGPPVFQTELGSYRLVPDDSPVPRLTLVLRSVSGRAAFGGVTTGLEALRRIGAELAGSGRFDLRIATTDPEDLPADGAAQRLEGIEVLARRGKGAEMPTRANDVFLAFNWFAAANLLPVLAEQAERFGVAPRPLFYLIQDYEPGFSPFSSDHLLARWALEPGWPVHAVVNSSLLADYLAMQGHAFARTYVFEPSLAAAMRPFLARAAGADRQKRIVAYGRPSVPRNCFPILKQGLELWAARHPEQADWEICSAGSAHRPIRLDGKRRVTSVGKLGLEAYARLLCESAVGVSLMSSPHPSYPPLEMAHFGMLVVTNRYANKDLGRLHDNIVSLADPRPETLAATLAEVCRRFDEDPRTGLAGASRMPGYTEGDPFPPAAEIAADIAALVRS